jgi:excisionase family DNA binding protein
MLWKTHIRICKKVLHELSLPWSSVEAQRLRDGIVDPDKWRGRLESHHYGKSGEIRSYILNARRNYLQNDLPNAFYNLGVALHFIQDAYVSFPSRFSPLKHQNWEQQIENLEDNGFVDDLESTIQYDLKFSDIQRNNCSWLAGELSREVQGKDNTLRIATLSGKEESESWASPIVDLNLAYRASLAVSKSVLGPKNCPELVATLSEELREYERLLQKSEISLSAEIAKSARQRDVWMGKIVQEPGFVRKIRNLFFRMRVGFQNWRTNGKMEAYSSQSHLHRVAEEYNHATSMTASPYEGWYNFQIPKISLSVVKKELLTIAEVSAILGFDTDTIKAMLSHGGFSSFAVGNRELISRSELNAILKRFTPNGIQEYVD